MEEKMKCCFCEKMVKGLGNNALPIKNDRCCDKCNTEFVVPIRILRVTNSPILKSLRQADRLAEKLRKENR